MKRLLVLMTAAVAVVMLTAASAGGNGWTRTRGAGELRDLQSDTAQPTDHATAQVFVVERWGRTTVYLKVQGLDHAAAGTVLGAHVHVGPCVKGAGAVAVAHYNTTPAGMKSVVNAETEVWLDFEIQPNGRGWAKATVPFIIPAGGAKSVVIHAEPTKATGAAGARWACLPVLF